MAFNVTAINPAAPSPAQSGQSSRDRAIAQMLGNQAPVNPSDVKPEDMTALTAPSEEAPVAKDEEVKAAEEAPKDDKNDKDKEPSENKEETPSEEKDPLSRQYALLARKEKALRAKVQAQDAAYKAKEDALLAKDAEIKAKEAKYQTDFISRESLKANPLQALAEAGLTYDDLTNLYIEQPKQADAATLHQIKTLEAKIAKLEGRQDTTQKTYEDQQKASYQQAVNQIRNEATKLVSNNPEFETIKATGSENDIVELIEKTYKEDGILLTVEEAAVTVEEYLVEEAIKLARLNKIQAKLKPAEPQKKPEAPKQSQPANQAKTLTNTMSTPRQMSARERAILAFKGSQK